MDALTTVFSVLFLSSFGLFTGMPPQAEDPLLERIAPPDTLVYFSWAGAGEADPESKNKTEQMLADEEVRIFVDGLKKRFGDTDWLDNVGTEQTPEEKEIANGAFELLGIIMTSPSAGFVSDMEFKKKEPEEPAEEEIPMDFGPGPGAIPGLPEFDLKPQFELANLNGAFIFNAGDRAERVSEIVDKLFAAAKDEDSDVEWNEPEEITIGGLKMQTAKSSDGVELFWGSRGPYFFGASGRRAIEDAVGGLTRKRGPPEWFTHMKEAVAVDRPSYRWYVDVGRLLAMMEEQSEDVKFAEVIEKSGIVHLRSISSVTGFDDVAMTTNTLYSLEGDPQEYLKFLPDQPLTTEDFQNIPADASWACAGQFDFAAVYEAMLKLEELAPAAEEPAEDAPEDEFGDEFGDEFDVGPSTPELTPEQKEMLKKLGKQFSTAIGPTWRLYNAPSDGGFLFTGMTAVVNVKHDQQLRAALADAVAAAKVAGYDVKTFTFRGEEVTYMRPNLLTGSFGSSAWCIVDDKLVWALYPQVIKSYLSRTDDEKTLADHPNVRGHLTGDDAPLAMTYVDTAGFYQTFYSLFQMFIPAIDGGLKMVEIDYPMHEIPSAAVIRKYVQPSIMTVRRDERGIVTQSQKTLPLGGGSWFTLAFISGLASEE